MPFARLARALDGLRRMPGEHYRVQLLDGATGNTLAVPSPRFSYYADPFLCEDEGRTWLFVEEWRYPENRGSIAALPLHDGLVPGPAVAVPLPGPHASFPFVFRDAGRHYLLPETSRAGCVDLYACDALPGPWRAAARLLEGVDCADSILHRHGGLWYLVTSAKRDADSRRRWLEIHVAESLLAGRWHPHPVNRERRYGDRDHGYGRNAGAWIEASGALLRPMQASERRYGERACMMQVLRLTPEAFEEVPFTGTHPLADIAARHATHHVSQAGHLLAWDTRTR